MNFQLVKQSAGKTQTRFHVVDSAGSICGIINVASEAASDLEKHWLSAPAQSSPKKANAGKQDRSVAAMVAASRPPSKEAVLLNAHG